MVLPPEAGFPLDAYLAPGLVLPFATGAGCWWGRCRFCPERAEGNAYRAAPVGDALRQVADLEAVRQHFGANPVKQALPVTAAEQHNRKPPDLFGLDQGQGLEQLVKGPEAAGRHDAVKQLALHDLEALAAGVVVGHGVIDEQARQVEQAGEPGHHEDDVERLDDEHGHFRSLRRVSTVAR